MDYPRTALSIGGAAATAAVAALVFLLTGSPLPFLAVPVAAFLLPIAWSFAGGRHRHADGSE